MGEKKLYKFAFIEDLVRSGEVEYNGWGGEEENKTK